MRRAMNSRKPANSSVEIERILKAARASGSLNLSNRSIKEVPDEVFQAMDAVKEGENWWETVELTKLILAHNEIENLKEDIKNLTQLAVLNVSNNNLNSLPSAIGELSMLKSLEMSCNKVFQLPVEIGAAVGLVKLDCSSNNIEDLPCSLGNCSELSDLKVSNNLIKGLPDELAKCSKLTKLDLEGNKITTISQAIVESCVMLTEINASKNALVELPDGIGRLTRLVRLNLHQNRISSLPPSLAGCCHLTELYLGNNKFTTLPPEIGALSQLKILDIHSNQLKEFPAEACTLQLSVLDLSNNSLNGLPPEIGKMTTLQKLLLIGNPIKTIRSSLVSGPTPVLLNYLRSRLNEKDEHVEKISERDLVSSAARLSLTSKEFSLQGMNLKSMPPEIWESGDVVKVDVTGNSIEQIPEQLSNCNSLNCLILSKNKISEWPLAAVTPLCNLLCLKLDNNNLKQIPVEAFRSLRLLEILYLSGNPNCFTLRPDISCLAHLRELYLRRIRLDEVPSDVFKLQLRIIDFSQNSLQQIPENFGSLSSLSELDLSDNDITSLPPRLGLLEPTLRVLKLDGNPLRSVRRAVLDKGAKAVLQYLKDKIVEN